MIAKLALLFLAEMRNKNNPGLAAEIGSNINTRSSVSGGPTLYISYIPHIPVCYNTINNSLSADRHLATLELCKQQN